MTLSLGSILPFYFSVKWFRTERRFLITSILIFATLIFPFELVILAVTQIAHTDSLSLPQYEFALVIKGVVSFLFFGVLIMSFHDTNHYPSAMSSRDLDPLKRGLKLAFTSCKLIRIIMAFTLNFCPLVMIYRANISHFQPYYILLASCLSIILLLLLHKPLRLHISTSFKISLVLSTLLNLLFLFLVNWVPELVIICYALRYFISYIVYEFSFQLVYPMHLMNVIMAVAIFSNSVYLILNGVNYILSISDESVYYAIVGLCMTASIGFSLSVQTYFKPV